MKPARKPVPEMRVFGIGPGQMRGIWPQVASYFKSFEDRSRGSILASDLLMQCMDGRRQCWIATDGEVVSACALTEVQEGPMTVVLLTFCAGENMENWWQEMVQTIKSWSKSIGAGRVTAIHRPGWKKFLEKEGFRQTHIMSEVDL